MFALVDLVQERLRDVNERWAAHPEELQQLLAEAEAAAAGGAVFGASGLGGAAGSGEVRACCGYGWSHG